MRRILYSVMGGTCLAFSADIEQVAAQERDTLRTDTMVFRIEEIRVQARRPVTTVGGASAIEVTVDSLDLPPAPTVEEILREIPTVHVRTNSRGEAEVTVRGSESRQVAILMDGVPLTLNWDARSDVSVIPAAAAHEINVVRGLSSILYGPNVLGGVVEMNVARGTRFPLRSTSSASGVYDGVGGYAAAGHTSVPLLGGGGRWLVRAGAGFRDSPGAPLAHGVEEPVTTAQDLRLNTDMSSTDGFVALRYLRDGGSWFTTSATTFRAERGIAGELGADEPRLWRYPHISRTIIATSAGTGDRETPFGRGDLEAAVGVDFGRTEIQSFTSRAYDQVDGNEVGDDRTLTLRLLGDHSLGGRGDVRVAFTMADIRHDATVDGDLAKYQQRLASLGAETAWRLLENPDGALQAVRATVGGALDRGDTPMTGGLPSLGTLNDWGARFGMTALTNEGNTLFHAGVSRRGRFPALREVYSEALNRFQPNPDLHPEYLTAFEGGVTTSVGRGELQVVGFHHRVTDAIRRITLPDRRRMRVNSDRLESTGIEVLFSQTLGGIGVGGDFTLQAVNLTDPTNGTSTEPENMPERMGRAYVQIPLGTVSSFSAEAAYTGAQFCQDPDSGEDLRLSGGTWLNADVARTWSLPTNGSGFLSRMEGRVSVDNLTDTALYHQCGLPRPGRLMRFQIRLF